MTFIPPTALAEKRPEAGYACDLPPNFRIRITKNNPLQIVTGDGIPPPVTVQISTCTIRNTAVLNSTQANHGVAKHRYRCDRNRQSRQSSRASHLLNRLFKREGLSCQCESECSLASYLHADNAPNPGACGSAKAGQDDRESQICDQLLVFPEQRAGLHTRAWRYI